MYDAVTDGRLQVSAALSLLECSRLVQWDPGAALFTPVSRETFEFSWRKDVDPVFGRLICWLNFSAGAEFLAKGVCLVHGVEIRWTQDVPAHPRADLPGWVKLFRKHWKSAGTIEATNFGTLRYLIDPNPNTKADAALKRLCLKVKAKHDEEELLLAVYQLLARTIRNRDAHAYVPNVRDDHYSLVPDLFSECFNLLTSWLPGGAATLTSWRGSARQFVDSL